MPNMFASWTMVYLMRQDIPRSSFHLIVLIAGDPSLGRLAGC